MAGHHFKGIRLVKKRDGFAISLDMQATQALLNKAQYMLDSQVSADICQYMPIKSGTLRQETAMLNATTAGQGYVYLYPPTSDYGHYQWKGELYVDPITGKGAFYSPEYGFWSRAGVAKVPSGRDLQYTEPMAHKDWGNWALAKHGKEWMKLVRRAFTQ